LAYLASQSGGKIFEFDDGTAKAFQFLYDMIHKHEIFPLDALNQDYNAQNEFYFQDKVPFMRQWPFVYGVGKDRKDWFAPNKMVVELPPAGPAGSHSWTGAWGWEIPKFAPNPDGAKQAVAYMTSVKAAPVMAKGYGGFILPRKSVVEAFKSSGDYILENTPNVKSKTRRDQGRIGGARGSGGSAQQVW